MKKFLSPHEIATLLLLLQFPAQVSLPNADLVALEQEGLAEVVASNESARPRLTADGVAILKRLGVA